MRLILGTICLIFAYEGNSVIFEPLEVQVCDNRNYTVYINASFRENDHGDGICYMDMDAIFSKDIGRDTSALGQFDYMRNQNEKPRRLTTLKNSDACAFMDDYVGEVWYGILTAIALPRGTCPVPAGKYHLRNYKVDTKKAKLVMFPPGYLKITYKFTEKKTKSLQGCLILIIRVK